ncbi:MAG TPA: biotin--[acetyl-CoA-carboxylase] ligase [bacterium (Candidatus Stahlbacteria)]|nr:biotin--[acetyl-CoA-carboxylase] ligase [Candidatus Stahlbacteria bacterium]
MKFQRRINFKTVESTQSVARKIDRKTPTVIWAEEQTGGQGRAGRSWFSPKGGVWISLMIPHPREERINHFVTMVGALSVVRLLEKIGVTSNVRWPNDIVINGRKVAGILGEYYQSAILCGIGINVNIYHFPKWIGPATSLALELDKTLDIDSIREEIIKIFEQTFLRFEQSGGKTIIKLIKPHFTSSGDVVTINYGKTKISGIVHDYDEEGALILRTETDRLIKIYSGELRRVHWF